MYSDFAKSLRSEINDLHQVFDRVTCGSDLQHFDIKRNPTFNVVARPRYQYQGWKHVMEITLESEDPDSIAKISVTKSKGKYGDPNIKVKDFSLPVSKIFGKIRAFVREAQNGCWDKVEQLKDLSKVLQSSVNTFLDLKIEYSASTRNEYDDFIYPQSLHVTVYGPDMKSFGGLYLAHAGIRDPEKVLEPNVFAYSQVIKTPEKREGHDAISEAEVIKKVKKLVSDAEKMWKTPEIRIKFDEAFAKLRKQEEERLRIQKEREEAARVRAEEERIRKEEAEKAFRLEQEEQARKKEEAARRKYERENKTTVNSAAQEKIGILETLASKSSKPEVKALANMIREMYESGMKPDDEQLKRIRNYLYAAGMRPQADHFRVASSKAVVQRWLSR